MTFGRSKTVSNILIRCPIASDEINTFCDLLDFVENLWDQTQTQKVLTSPEAMGHRMRMFDTVLERPKVILLVFESHRNILVKLGNTWSTFGNNFFRGGDSGNGWKVRIWLIIKVHNIFLIIDYNFSRQFGYV